LACPWSPNLERLIQPDSVFLSKTLVKYTKGQVKKKLDDQVDPEVQHASKKFDDIFYRIDGKRFVGGLRQYRPHCFRDQTGR
jgi:hypothetical protein